MIRWLSFLIVFYTLPIIAQLHDSVFYRLDTVYLESGDYFQSTTNLRNSNQDLAQSLSQKSSVYIKNYGLGNLSTISFQGASSNQNTVFWKGINLNPVNSGTTDFSLIDAYLFDSYSFSTSQNTKQGSAIGADIVLESNTSLDSGFHYSATIKGGSFNNYKLGLKTSYKNKKSTFYGAILASKAQNNYRFYNPISKEFQQRENNELEQIGTRLAYNRVFKKFSLSLDSWNKLSDRNIASPIHVVNQKENQKDDFSRNVLSFASIINKKIDWNQSLAYLFESYTYSNPTAKIIGKGKFHRFNYQTSFEKYWSPRYESTLSFFANYTDALVSELQVNRSSSGFSYLNKLNITKRLSSAFTIRKEFYLSEKNLPLALDASLNWKQKEYKLFLRFYRNARIPTLNDLYWANGGNKDLKSELAQTAYLGINRNSKIKLNAELFYGNISQMIIWLPNNDNGLWTPQNITQVTRKGLTAELKYGFKLAKSKVELGTVYSYTSAKPLNEEQIIYTPKNTLKSWCELESAKGFGFAYYFQLVGERYLAKDHSSRLPMFTVSDIKVYKEIKLKEKNSFRTELKVDNLFSYTYYNLPFRPMPRRYVELALVLNH